MSAPLFAALFAAGTARTSGQNLFDRFWDDHVTSFAGTARRRLAIIHGRLFLGSGVLVLVSRHQGCYECAEQRFSPFAGIVDELEEGEVDWKLLLGNASVGP